ncbi:Sulfotransferase family protein [Novosphingobium sp. CF614]|uniref:sulfotransferase n=1 Tax=Novosphingobium sp. CF614 TaxID=1884364 RepID=UPI0008F25D19|nr:sulfotransferase [Novosphingobium sp. CF614]SFG20373.1 Sulfotransferase family protein [Novosphingobium sp. CF614]
MNAHRPNFICIGPKRSATTWLADQLKFHRDIWLPPIQELSYLSGGFPAHADKPYMTMRWTRWEITKRIIRNKGPGIAADRAFLRTARQLAADPAFDLDGYRALFGPAGSRVTGDISPMYASMTAAEIAQALPALAEARVFLLARNPIDRFWSELSMHARKQTFGTIDYGTYEVARAFFDDPERQKQHFLSGIVERWRDAIGANKLGILYFDDIVTHPERTLRQIVHMIGADWSKRLPGLAPDRNRKQARVAFTPSPGVRDAVRGWFSDELDRCAALFGTHGVAWRERSAC